MNMQKDPAVESVESGWCVFIVFITFELQEGSVERHKFASAVLIMNGEKKTKSHPSNVCQFM